MSQEIIKKYDADGDGQLSRQERRQYFRDQRNRELRGQKSQPAN